MIIGRNYEPSIREWLQALERSKFEFYPVRTPYYRPEHVSVQTFATTSSSGLVDKYLLEKGFEKRIYGKSNPLKADIYNIPGDEVVIYVYNTYELLTIYLDVQKKVMEGIIEQSYIMREMSTTKMMLMVSLIEQSMLELIISYDATLRDTLKAIKKD